MSIRRRTQSLIVAALSVVLAATTTSLAVAADVEINEPKAQRIEQIVETAKEHLGVIDDAVQIRPRGDNGTLLFESTGGSTSVSVESTGISFSPLGQDKAEDLFSLEDDSVTPNFSTTSDGSILLSGENKDYLVDSYANGSLRIQAVISSADTEHRIPFEINLQDDERVQIESDGSIGFYRLFEDEETLLLTSIIERPWAVDAVGRRVSTRFTLEGTKLVQIVEPDSLTTYPVTADPFWIPAIIAGLRIGSHVLIKVGPRVVKYAVAPASRVVKALRNFKPIAFRAGSNVVRLDRPTMKHILERHHPQYWNGKEKTIQTFFNPKMSVADVRTMINGALRQHASSLSTLRSGRGVYTGSYNGVKYKLTVSNGRVVQFYPR